MTSKGDRGEYELRDELEERGFTIIRAPASGSAGHRLNEDGEKVEREAPDILAGNGEDFYAFESKRYSDPPIYLEKKEMEDLEVFAEAFQAEAYAAVRFDREDWYFIKREDMPETEKSYRADSFKPEDAIELDEL